MSELRVVFDTNAFTPQSFPLLEASPMRRLCFVGRIVPVYSPSEQWTMLHRKLDSCMLAFAAVGPRAPLMAAQWWQFDDPDIQEASPGSSRYGQFIEILPQPFGTDGELNVHLARELTRLLMNLAAGKVRSKVEVALQRVSQAVRRHNAGDKAVEVAIALEALMSDSSNAEVGHKVKVRAVRLLGRDPARRRRNAKIITEMYNVRSKLVHEGRAPGAETKDVVGTMMTMPQIVDAALELSAELIRVVLRRGSLPDWVTFDIDAEPATEPPAGPVRADAGNAPTA